MRRECIYAFRTLAVTNCRVKWEKYPQNTYKNTIQQAVVDVGNYGTDKSVPYAHVGLNPYNVHPAVIVGGGTHKCVPYEHDWPFPIHQPDKFQFICLLRQAGIHLFERSRI